VAERGMHSGGGAGEGRQKLSGKRKVGKNVEIMLAVGHLSHLRPCWQVVKISF
jgi:hypothetical protein